MALVGQRARQLLMLPPQTYYCALCIVTPTPTPKRVSVPRAASYAQAPRCPDALALLTKSFTSLLGCTCMAWPCRGHAGTIGGPRLLRLLLRGFSLSVSLHHLHTRVRAGRWGIRARGHGCTEPQGCDSKPAAARFTKRPAHEASTHAMREACSSQAAALAGGHRTPYMRARACLPGP